MNKKHSRYPLIAKIGTALQVAEKCYTGTEPWATPAFILYRAGLGVYAIKTSTIQDDLAARGERPAKR